MKSTQTTVATDRNKFVDCAIAVSADFIVTNDRHFDILKDIPFPIVDTIKAEDFLILLQNDFMGFQ